MSWLLAGILFGVGLILAPLAHAQEGEDRVLYSEYGLDFSNWRPCDNGRKCCENPVFYADSYSSL
jgi:hypothetical protein